MSIELDNDISLAKQVVKSKDNNFWRYVFTENSGIYRGTTEMISDEHYQNALRDRKKILSVIASGDQIINSILLGSKDITGYDISRFPKYYLMLKLAALSSLSKKEYLSFFFHKDKEEKYGDDVIYKLGRRSKFFSEKLYSKLYPNLDKDSKVFWDNLFNSYSAEELINSPLFAKSNLRPSIDNMCILNPYLQDNNYKKIKSKLDNINIKFFQNNIFELVKDDIGEFDLINLSNIVEYMPSEDKELEEYRKMVENLPLTPNGIALTYLETYEHYWDRAGRLDNFDDNYEKICFDNGMLGFAPDGLLIYDKGKALKKTKLCK